MSTDKHQTDDPRVLYKDLDEKMYLGEACLLDRYIAFSTEIVRLALLSIAVFGFLLKEDIFVVPKASYSPKGIVASIGIAMLSVSIMLSLWFRYRATRAFQYYIHGLRLHKQEEPELDSLSKEAVMERNGKLKHCPKLKGLSALALILGAISISIAYSLQILQIE